MTGESFKPGDPVLVRHPLTRAVTRATVTRELDPGFVQVTYDDGCYGPPIVRERDVTRREPT